MIELASEFDIHRVLIHIGKAARFYFIFVSRDCITQDFFLKKIKKNQKKSRE